MKFTDKWYIAYVICCLLYFSRKWNCLLHNIRSFETLLCKVLYIIWSFWIHDSDNFSRIVCTFIW